MKKNPTSPLRLHRETLHRLAWSGLEAARGGDFAPGSGGLCKDTSNLNPCSGAPNTCFPPTSEDPYRSCTC